MSALNEVGKMPKFKNKFKIKLEVSDLPEPELKALRNQEKIHDVKEEIEKMLTEVFNIKEHLIIQEKLAVDLESSVNVAMELHALEKNRSAIIIQNSEKQQATYTLGMRKADEYKAIFEYSLYSTTTQFLMDALYDIFYSPEKVSLNCISSLCHQENLERVDSKFSYIKNKENLLTDNQISSNIFNEVFFARKNKLFASTSTNGFKQTFDSSPLFEDPFRHGMKSLKGNRSPLTPVGSPISSRKHRWKEKDDSGIDVSCPICTEKLSNSSSKIVECSRCKLHCHDVCAKLFPTCKQSKEFKSSKPNTPKSASKSFRVGKLEELVSKESPKVPGFIAMCVSEIDIRGVNELNLYKEYVSEKEIVSIIKEKLKVKGKIHLKDISVHKLCGCLTGFLRRLNEPLVPCHKTNMLAKTLQISNKTLKEEEFLSVIEGLEQANKDTLIFIILHLQRIVLKNIRTCSEVSMKFRSIFGCSKDDGENIPVEAESTDKIIAELINLPSTVLVKILSAGKDDEDKQPPRKYNFFNTPNASIKKIKKIIRTSVTP